MHVCRKCEAYELRFNRNYRPDEFIEGNPDATIWIIGLNPKDEPTSRSLDDLLIALDNELDRHSYFADFGKVSQSIRLHSEGNAAHTDLVKCACAKWPSRGKSGIIGNCREYLEAQLQRHTPRIIVCNGSDVSREIQGIIVPAQELKDDDTQYEAELNGCAVTVILSGFLGRLDDFAKRRLGYEIEGALQKHL